MRPRQDSFDFVKLYQKKFQCLDEKDRFISGNFNTGNASQIRVYLNRCQGKDYCKTDEEINEFVRGKFLIVYANEIRFESQLYGKESIIKESHMDWVRISTYIKFELPYEVSKSELSLQDELIDLDEITEMLDSSVFEF